MTDNIKIRITKAWAEIQCLQDDKEWIRLPHNLTDMSMDDSANYTTA
jgi:hypothetical protein